MPPPPVQVPFLATAKGAIDRDTMTLATAQFASGVSINGTASRLKEIANSQFYERQLVYYSFAKEVKDYKAAQRELGHGWQGPELHGRQYTTVPSSQFELLSTTMMRLHLSPPRHPLTKPTQVARASCGWRLSALAGRELTSRPPLAARRRQTCTMSRRSGWQTCFWPAPRPSASKSAWQLHLRDADMHSGDLWQLHCVRGLSWLEHRLSCRTLHSKPTSTARYMGLWLAALGGMYLKLDHSFKVVRRVRDATGQKQFAAILTLMNEFCQVGLPEGSVTLVGAVSQPKGQA